MTGAPTARDALREAGLRATAPRVAVLRCLSQAERPLSHSDVMERLGEHTWDRATVYRNLSDLADAGLLSKRDHGDKVWRFEVAGRHDHHDPGAHPHFVCVDCGTVQCLPEVQVSFGNAVPKAVADAQVEVQVRGVCDDCG